ncbi:unnamed protein product [Arabis nemorensis]|uniref:RST domain-containing protein n=1 Tax=Arabis nemorensis TaxID=586526 RepID=A0A565AUM9_9BRAS|nr:unnamed protein product [Arabis nemorensis]
MIDLSIFKLVEEHKVESSVKDVESLQVTLNRDMEEDMLGRTEMNHTRNLLQICEFLTILRDLVDENRKRQLLILYDKYKREKIPKEGFYQQVKDVAGRPLTELAIRKLQQLRQGNMGIKAPGPSHNRVSLTSAEIDDQKSDPRGVHVNQLPSTSSGTLSISSPVQGFNKNPQQHIQLPSSSGTLSSSATGVGGPIKSTMNMTTVPKLEKPISVNATSRVQGSAISHFQNNSSLPVDFPHSMTTHLDSSTMDYLSGPFGTTQAGINVVTTPNMPSVGRKKPLETLGSSLPPSRKKQKVCSTSSRQKYEQLNDVTADIGINLEEEEEQLLSSSSKQDGQVSKALQRLVHEEEDRTFLQKIPLQRKLTEIMVKSGLEHMSDDVERCLSMCVEERMHGLLSNIIRLSKQRTDAEKCRNRTLITSDIRKQIYEMNQKMKEEWERNHPEEKEPKNGENDTEQEDNRSKQMKGNKEEEEKMRAKANVAAHAAVGGNDVFLKWKLMAEARQKPSTGPGKNSKKPCAETGGSRFGKNQGSPKVVRSISVNDVIAAVEKEPQMSKSTLLYRLYNRVYSEDVQSEEKKT